MTKRKADLIFVAIYTMAVIGALVFDWRAGVVVALVLALAGFIINRLVLERYRQALENSPNSIFVVNRSGHITMWNPASAALFQRDAGAALGQHFDFLMADAAETAHINQMLNRVFTDEEPLINVDLRFQTREGRIHEMVSSMYPLFDSRQRVAECIISNMEFTERKQMEAALKESEERFRQIVENIEEVFYVIDVLNRKVDYISPVFERYRHWLPAGILSDPQAFVAIIHPDDRDHVHQAIFVTGEDRELEFRLLNNGETYWARVSHSRLYNDEGRLVRIVGIAEDVTAQRQAGKLALERERMRILTDFIRDASHEFRTPLSIINTKLYLINHTPDRARAQELMRQINEQVSQIDRLLESLVLMSRLDSGIAFANQSVNLNAILTTLVEDSQPAASDHHITLTLKTTPSLPAIRGDVDLMEQAFYHLIDNALRYTSAGGQVVIRTYTYDGQAVVEIQDTGSGIDPADLPRIFERFYRSDTAHSTRGFGLGLPIAQKVIEGHGGLIEIESQPGEGTCFRVVLPLDNAAMLSRTRQL